METWSKAVEEDNNPEDKIMAEARKQWKQLVSSPTLEWETRDVKQ